MKKAMFILIGIVIGIVGSCYAAYKLTASQVSFDKSKTNLNSSDVQEAIDEIATDILSYGDAESSDIANGKTALVKGKKVTGTAATNSVEIYRNCNYFTLNELQRQSIIYDGVGFLNYEYIIYDNGIKFLKSGTVRVMVDFLRTQNSPSTFTLDGYINNQINSSLIFHQTLPANTYYHYHTVSITVNKNDILDFKFNADNTGYNVVSIMLLMD